MPILYKSPNPFQLLEVDIVDSTRTISIDFENNSTLSQGFWMEIELRRNKKIIKGRHDQDYQVATCRVGLPQLKKGKGTYSLSLDSFTAIAYVKAANSKPISEQLDSLVEEGDLDMSELIHPTQKVQVSLNSNSSPVFNSNLISSVRIDLTHDTMGFRFSTGLVKPEDPLFHTGLPLLVQYYHMHKEFVSIVPAYDTLFTRFILHSDSKEVYIAAPLELDLSY